MSDDLTKCRFICCIRTFGETEAPVFDSEGFIICPTHKQRRYGWRSPRLVQVRTHVLVKGDKMTFVARPKWGETDIERDKAVVAELFPAGFEEESAVNRTFVLTEEEMAVLGK